MLDCRAYLLNIAGCPVNYVCMFSQNRVYIIIVRAKVVQRKAFLFLPYKFEVVDIYTWEQILQH